MGVIGFKMFCQRGSNFFLLALCMCGGGGGGGQVQYFSFREKITDSTINKWLAPITKSPKVTTWLIFFKILLVI